jgi:tetratricopeptide (TPR) repeat protein
MVADDLGAIRCGERRTPFFAAAPNFPTDIQGQPPMKLASILAVGVVSGLLLAQPVFANDTPTSTDAPDLAVPRAMIKTMDWPGAVAALKKIAETTTHADVYSLLGFSLRNAGDVAQAKVFYAKALDFDPNHKGAHEYLGELYLKIDDLPKAQEQLMILQKLCPNGCEELADLTKTIAQTNAAPATVTTKN